MPKRSVLDSLILKPERGGLCRTVNVRSGAVYDVAITRPSKWGNPFVIGVDGDRNECVDKYILWLPQQQDLMKSLHELVGRVLGCVCLPKRCHGPVIAGHVNGLRL